ncbi:hypothetical protein [Streptomyces sp. NPDC127112]|uniref:hypothetical protein n=1 Tax=Streptomyces sp. NPDC127112 TaxID=3345364 RepID=UPI0036258AB3
MTTTGNPIDFRSMRRDWFEAVAQHLSGWLRKLSPEIHSVIPDDLGPRELLAATALARIAQADTERQDIGHAAGDLVRLAGARGTRGPERVGEVEALWTRLRGGTVPLLLSWWREPLGEGLLAYWARTRAESVGWPQVHRELRERWGVDSDGIWRRGLGPGQGPEVGDWRGYFEFLAERLPAHEVEFTHMLLTRTPGLAEEIDAFTAECGADLMVVPHLALVHMERRLAEALTTVVEGNLDAVGGEEAPDHGFASALQSIRDTGRAYLRWLEDRFIPELTPLERAHLVLDSADAARVEAYLREYAGAWCAPGMPALPTPVFTEEDFAPMKPAERPKAIAPQWMGRLGEVLATRGHLGWTGVVGSQPWWLYVAEAGLESAAALRFKHDGQVRISHRTLDDPHDMVVRFPPTDPDAQNLIMRFGYDEDDAHQMCELLVLASAGRTHLGFLVRDASGAFRVLRTVSVPIPPPLREAMRAKALHRLDAMTGGDAGVLAKLIAPEPDTPPAAPASTAAPEDETEDEWLDGGLFPRSDTLF